MLPIRGSSFALPWAALTIPRIARASRASPASEQTMLTIVPRTIIPPNIALSIQDTIDTAKLQISRTSP